MNFLNLHDASSSSHVCSLFVLQVWFHKEKKEKKNFASNAFQLQNLKYQMPVLPWAPWQVSELSLFTAAWQWDVNVASKETRVWCRKYPWNVVKWLKPKKMNAIMKEIMIPHALHHYTTKKWFLTSLSVFKYNKTPKSLQYCCADTCISYCKCNASLKLGMVKEAILKWCTNFGIFSSHIHAHSYWTNEWVSSKWHYFHCLHHPNFIIPGLLLHQRQPTCLKV